MQTPPQQQPDTRFISYCARREKGATAAQLVADFPQAASFERMFRDNAMARQADDVFSPSGERGRTFDRDEVPSYGEILHGAGR